MPKNSKQKNKNEVTATSSMRKGDKQTSKKSRNPSKVSQGKKLVDPKGIRELAKFISGEAELEKNRAQMDRLKKEAVERQKDSLRESVNRGTVYLEPEMEYTPDKILADGGAPEKVVQKIDLYKWDAPVRIQFPFDMKVFMGIVGLSLIFILYLAVLGHYGLMFSLAALLFFLYVAGTTEPVIVTHAVTTRGIETLEKLYEWYMLKNFYFTKKNDSYFIIVDTKLRYPSSLIMLIDKKDITPVFLLLQDKMLYKDMRRYNRLDRISFGEFIKLEDI